MKIEMLTVNSINVIKIPVHIFVCMKKSWENLFYSLFD